MVIHRMTMVLSKGTSSRSGQIAHTTRLESVHWSIDENCMLTTGIGQGQFCFWHGQLCR